ncbi:hypothetical protein [Paenibacillus apis]|uniref:Uncharacterized protein n=1 Tax=Paenibacillus apis TaxID=1792174 RepID=A0A919Y4S0_9BACL|nr:hypothetical protein [Paenibacillus apis]GIO44101.1 hypothetical protein J41TS4_38590 [Paenibacillus apis]
MRADVQNLFIRIHMLNQATLEKLTVSGTLALLESQGYKVGEREVKQELEQLTDANFLTSYEDNYSITGAGMEEMKEIRGVLDHLCKTVKQTPQRD